jgi:hypothetical protein
VRAPADGYTLLLATGPNAINTTLYEKLNAHRGSISRKRRERFMSLWCLWYRRSGQIEVAIVQGASLMHARLGAALDGIDADATFAEGHKLDAERVGQVPPRYIGRMLSRKEAAVVLDRIGRDPKSPKKR